MHKHTFRTLLIAAALIVSFIYIYPTVGWMAMSDASREARLKQWQEEDRIFEKPNAWKDLKKSVRRWAQCDRARVINLGLDLQGGIQMTIGLDMDSVDPSIIQEMKDGGLSDKQIVSEFQTMALRTIERRVNEFGSKEPIIQAYGDRQIQIQLPGEKNVDRARQLIMKQAHLTFQIEVQPEATAKVFSDIERKFPRQFLPYLKRGTRGQGFEFDAEYFDNISQVVKQAQETPGLIPEGQVIAFSNKPKPWDEVKRYKLYLLEKQQMMSGEHLKQASARPNPESIDGSFMILFALDGEGGRLFGEATEKNVGRNMSIVVDGVVESSPTINSRITTNGEITGDFSSEEARDLAIALNSGSMPAKIKEEFTGVVGATLGSDSVRQGVISGIFAVILVILFMGYYYRLPGIIADIAQVVNAILILATLAYFNTTLTLPGIAGLILTIGMAVDSNVLIYERIREEMRNGRSMLASIDNGFKRAQVTIVDANLTTVIAAAVLFQFGSGPVKGFAITLIVGICASVFVSLVVCRAMFDFLAERNLLGKLYMMSIIKPDTHIGFMAKRRVCMLASISIIVIGLVAFAVRTQSSYGMFGVDFTTGTNMVINLHGTETVPVADVREKLTEAGFTEPVVQEYEQSAEMPNRFMIRIPDVEVAADAAAPSANPEDATVSGKVQAALASLASDAPAPANAGDSQTAKVEMEQVQTVGPTVGEQLKKDAVYSLLLSFFFMIIYVAFRFEFTFGVGAVVALVHDVLITVGIFALFHRQISITVIAALLTIVGYSINDTIVVFDRIRENMKLYRGRGMSLMEIMDLSINQTLSRTILTSFTTFIVVVVLLFLGGSVIFDFALALAVGIVVGTYSSIYIASAIAHYLSQFKGTLSQREKTSDKEVSTRRRRTKKKDSEDAEETV